MTFVFSLNASCLSPVLVCFASVALRDLKTGLCTAAPLLGVSKLVIGDLVLACASTDVQEAYSQMCRMTSYSQMCRMTPYSEDSHTSATTASGELVETLLHVAAVSAPSTDITWNSLQEIAGEVATHYVFLEYVFFYQVRVPRGTVADAQVFS